MRRLLMVLVCLLILPAAQADGTLFYQPQQGDAALGAERWQRLWERSAEHGVQRVVVQWTRHGTQDFGGPGGWLAKSLQAAQDQGLALVLGLAHDPAYYRVLPDEQRFATYWHRQLGRSLAQSRRLREQWGLSPAGWYLPLELDDWLFRDAAIRRELERQLREFVAALDAPLHVSAFSGGVLAPRAMAGWMSALEAAGMHVWWQDGRGTRALSTTVRQAYEEALDCRIGIVREAFRQISEAGDAFAAEPRAPQVAPACHDAAVFSLRYRPWAVEVFEERG